MTAIKTTKNIFINLAPLLDESRNDTHSISGQTEQISSLVPKAPSCIKAPSSEMLILGEQGNFLRWREPLCRYPLSVKSLVLIGQKRKVAPEADLAVPLSSVINPTEHF